MHIKDHSGAMKFFRTYDNVASKGKWKKFVDEMEFESMVQEPRIMAEAPYLGMGHGGIDDDFDALSPREERYYQQGPFSTHSDFLAAKGGRIGFKHGGSWADWRSNHSEQMTFEEYLQMDMNKPVHPIDKSTGGRVGMKPGGIVEPGVTHYGTPEGTGIQLSTKQINLLKESLTKKEFSQLKFGQPLKADALDVGVRQRENNKLWKKVTNILEPGKQSIGIKILNDDKLRSKLIQITNAGDDIDTVVSKMTKLDKTLNQNKISSAINSLVKRGDIKKEFGRVATPGKESISVGEFNKRRNIIDQQLKLKNIPTLEAITTKSGYTSNVPIKNYILETKGEKFFEKEFSYEAGKMKVGTLKDRKKIFDYIQNKNTTSLEKIGKNFGWGKTKTSGLIAELLGDLYRKRGTGTSIYLPENMDLLKKVTTTIRNSPDFEDIYQRRMYDLLQDAYHGRPKEEYVAAWKKMNNYFGVTKALRKKVPILGMNLDHVIPFGFLEMIEAGKNPMDLIRVKPIPREVNTFKRHFDKARIDVIEGLKKSPKDKKLLEQFKALKQFENMAPIEFGGVTKTGNITEWGAKPFGKSKLLTDLKNAPKLYKSVYNFAQDVLSDPDKLTLAQKAGVAQTEKMFKDIPELTAAQETKYKKNLKSLIEKIGCPGLAAGGRVGFADGSRCFNKGLAVVKNKNFESPAQAKNMLKLAEAGAKSSALRGMLGIYGLAGEAIIEAGIGAYKVLGQGVPAKIAWAESYWSYLDPRKYTGELSNLRRKDLEKASPRVAKYYDALGVLEKRDYHSKWINQTDPNDPTHESHANKLKQYDEIIRNFYGGPKGITNMMERLQPEVANAEAEQAGKWARKKEEKYGWMFPERLKEFQADRKQKLAMKEFMASHNVKTMPYTKDTKPVYEIDKEVIDRDLKMFGDYFGYGWTPYGHYYGMQQKKPGIGDKKYNEDLGYRELVDDLIWNKGMENLSKGAPNMAGGGLANLTRTVAPDSEGILSLKKKW